MMDKTTNYKYMMKAIEEIAYQQNMKIPVNKWNELKSDWATDQQSIKYKFILELKLDSMMEILKWLLTWIFDQQASITDSSMTAIIPTTTKLWHNLFNQNWHHNNNQYNTKQYMSINIMSNYLPEVDETMESIDTFENQLTISKMMPQWQ